MIRLATIGRGNIARQFIAGAKISGQFSLEAVYSRNEETGREWADQQGCSKVHTDLQALANDPDIDAVYIASPNVCHGPQTEIMLQGGKHVICEKPIATSAEEYRRLKALADEKGLVYMEAIIPRFVPWREKILQALASIGKISTARIDYAQLTSRYEKLQRGEQVNIFDMSLAAGTLMDLGIYCVYGAVDLLGMPQNIVATAGFLESGADSNGTAIFDYGTFSAALTYAKLGEGGIGSEITGDKGTLVIRRIGLYTETYVLRGNERKDIFDTLPKENIMCYEAAAFAEFIRGENLEDYRKASELAQQVHICMDKIKRSADIRYGGKV